MTIINQWFVALPLVDCCYERFWKVKKKEQKAIKTDRKETGAVVWESRLPLCANRLLGGVINFRVEQKKLKKGSFAAVVGIGEVSDARNFNRTLIF